jgi:hypothetical protein
MVMEEPFKTSLSDGGGESGQMKNRTGGPKRIGLELLGSVQAEIFRGFHHQPEESSHPQAVARRRMTDTPRLVGEWILLGIIYFHPKMGSFRTAAPARAGPFHRVEARHNLPFPWVAWRKPKTRCRSGIWLVEKFLRRASERGKAAMNKS